MKVAAATSSAPAEARSSSAWERSNETGSVARGSREGVVGREADRNRSALAAALQAEAGLPAAGERDRLGRAVDAVADLLQRIDDPLRPRAALPGEDVEPVRVLGRRRGGDPHGDHRLAVGLGADVGELERRGRVRELADAGVHPDADQHSERCPGTPCGRRAVAAARGEAPRRAARRALRPRCRRARPTAGPPGSAPGSTARASRAATTRTRRRSRSCRTRGRRRRRRRAPACADRTRARRARRRALRPRAAAAPPPSGRRSPGSGSRSSGRRCRRPRRPGAPPRPAHERAAVKTKPAKAASSSGCQTWR